MIRRLVAAATFGALCAFSPSAWAHHSGMFTFTVSRDGTPIGEHRVTFRHQGDRVEIETDMELKVSFAMVPVFRFSHRSHEIWQDGKPILISATTDDDGRELDITVRANGHGLIRTVNDRTDKLDGSTKVLALWNQDTVTSPPGNFVSIVEDETLEVAFHYLGKETMTIAGGSSTSTTIRWSAMKSVISGTMPTARWRGSNSCGGARRSSTCATSTVGCRSRSRRARSRPSRPAAGRSRLAAARAAADLASAVRL